MMMCKAVTQSCRLAILVGLVFFYACTALAQQEGQRFQDWTLGCEKPEGGGAERCYIYQTVVENKNDQPVLQMAVGYLPNNNTPAAILTVPLGVALPPGMGITVDNGEMVKFQFERCVPKGCVAGLPLDNKMINKFKRGAKALIVVHDGRKPISLPISLKGFTKGFNSLKP